MAESGREVEPQRWAQPLVRPRDHVVARGALLGVYKVAGLFLAIDAGVDVLRGSAPVVGVARSFGMLNMVLTFWFVGRVYERKSVSQRFGGPWLYSVLALGAGPRVPCRTWRSKRRRCRPRAQGMSAAKELADARYEYEQAKAEVAVSGPAARRVRPSGAGSGLLTAPASGSTAASCRNPTHDRLPRALELACGQLAKPCEGLRLAAYGCRGRPDVSETGNTGPAGGRTGMAPYHKRTGGATAE